MCKCTCGIFIWKKIDPNTRERLGLSRAVVKNLMLLANLSLRLDEQTPDESEDERSNNGDNAVVTQTPQ